MGCWKDETNRAIDGFKFASTKPIEDCYQFAKLSGWSVFAVQGGRECFTEVDAGEKYQKYGESTDCGEGGKGGPWAMNVYLIAPDCEHEG